MADGRINSTFARILVPGDKTVRNHIMILFANLQVTHCVNAFSVAHDAGAGTHGGTLAWH